MNKFQNKKDTKKIILKLKLKLDSSEDESPSDIIIENSVKGSPISKASKCDSAL